MSKGVCLMNAIKMNGIKLSSRHVLMHQTFAHTSDCDPIHLYQQFSDDKINILFLSAAFLDKKTHIVCCVEPDQFDSVKELEKFKSPLKGQLNYIPSAGILSVYPHQFQIKSLGYLLYCFGVEKFKFYYLASSPSMLSFTIDYGDQQAIAASLATHIDLPHSHTPYRQEVNMDEFLKYFKKEPETAASYVEKKIKTYAIQTRDNVKLCRFDIHTDLLAVWGDHIQRLDDLGIRFHYVSAFISEKNHIRLFSVLESENSHFNNATHHFFSDIFPKELSACCDFLLLADIISFHGPHFGDRYGISAHAFSAMQHRSIPVLLMGCVGSSISIVVPAGMSQKGRDALSEFFETP
jgi:hypothetical protein